MSSGSEFSRRHFLQAGAAVVGGILIGESLAHRYDLLQATGAYLDKNEHAFGPPVIDVLYPRPTNTFYLRRNPTEYPKRTVALLQPHADAQFVSLPQAVALEGKHSRQPVQLATAYLRQGWAVITTPDLNQQLVEFLSPARESGALLAVGYQGGVFQHSGTEFEEVITAGLDTTPEEILVPTQWNGYADSNKITGVQWLTQLQKGNTTMQRLRYEPHSPIRSTTAMPVDSNFSITEEELQSGKYHVTRSGTVLDLNHVLSFSDFFLDTYIQLLAYRYQKQSGNPQEILVSLPGWAINTGDAAYTYHVAPESVDESTLTALACHIGIDFSQRMEAITQATIIDRIPFLKSGAHRHEMTPEDPTSNAVGIMHTAKLLSDSGLRREIHTLVKQAGATVPPISMPNVFSGEKRDQLVRVRVLADIRNSYGQYDHDAAITSSLYPVSPFIPVQLVDTGDRSMHLPRIPLPRSAVTFSPVHIPIWEKDLPDGLSQVEEQIKTKAAPLLSRVLRGKK